MINDEYSKIHPEQRDATRAARRRYCVGGVTLVAIVAATISLIVVYSKSSASPENSLSGSSCVQSYNGSKLWSRTATISLTNRSDRTCAAGSGFVISGADLRASTSFARVENHLGEPGWFRSGAALIRSIGGGFAGIVNESYSMLVMTNGTTVSNVTFHISAQLTTVVLSIGAETGIDITDMAFEFVTVCLDINPTPCGSSAVATGMNLRGVEVSSTGTFAASWSPAATSLSAGWYQSDSRSLLVRETTVATWTNASGSLASSSDDQCVFSLPSYGAIVRTFESDVVYLGDWTLVGGVLGSPEYPEVLRRPRPIRAFMGPAETGAIRFVTSDATSNTSDVITSLYDLPSRVADGTVLYFDTINKAHVDFSTVPRFPAACPASLRLPWEGDLSRFVASKFASRPWVQLLD